MIQIKNLTKIYKKQIVVNGVSFNIQKGETFGLVGESGSGKSTLGKMIMGLIEPTSGEVYFDGEKKRKLLPKRCQMIFQDPYSTLNPRMKIESILKEPTEIHHLPNRVDELLDLVLLPSSAKKKYPHEFSGGQRQRIGIARALALNPDFLICDEPISALDVSIQAQIINLLQQLQKNLGLTLLFIAHDILMVRHISSRIALMQNGCIIEEGQTDELFANPQHIVTKLFFKNFLTLSAKPPFSLL